MIIGFFGYNKKAFPCFPFFYDESLYNKRYFRPSTTSCQVRNLDTWARASNMYKSVYRIERKKIFQICFFIFLDLHEVYRFQTGKFSKDRFLVHGNPSLSWCICLMTIQVAAETSSPQANPTQQPDNRPSNRICKRAIYFGSNSISFRETFQISVGAWYFRW